MTTIEECNALVAELLAVWRAVTPEASQPTGADLLRWRLLPENERQYFAALMAAYEDPHRFTRKQTQETHADGGVIFHYDPPHPQQCECARPVFVDYIYSAVRCSRCLQAWRLRPHLAASVGGGSPPVEQLRGVLIDAVQKSDMGYAIERVLPALEAAK
jgi:hypothetical protein